MGEFCPLTRIIKFRLKVQSLTFQLVTFQVEERDLGGGDVNLFARLKPRLVDDVRGQEDAPRALRPDHGHDRLRHRLRRLLVRHAQPLPHACHGAHGRLPELAGGNGVYIFDKF